MNQQQLDILDGHTIAELCVLLTDLQYQSNNIASAQQARRAGITPQMVAQALVERLSEW